MKGSKKLASISLIFLFRKKLVVAAVEHWSRAGEKITVLGLPFIIIACALPCRDSFGPSMKTYKEKDALSEEENRVPETNAFGKYNARFFILHKLQMVLINITNFLLTEDPFLSFSLPKWLSSENPFTNLLFHVYMTNSLPYLFFCERSVSWYKKHLPKRALVEYIIHLENQRRTDTMLMKTLEMKTYPKSVTLALTTKLNIRSTCCQ